MQGLLVKILEKNPTLHATFGQKQDIAQTTSIRKIIARNRAVFAKRLVVTKDPRIIDNCENWTSDKLKNGLYHLFNFY